MHNHLILSTIKTLVAAAVNCLPLVLLSNCKGAGMCLDANIMVSL